MASLTEPQKREICEALAGFSSPSAIIAYFRSEYGIELSHKQVGRYDPTRPYFDAGDKWRDVFWGRRKACLENVADVPIAHLGYRLNMLQKAADAASLAGNWPLVCQILDQAARAVSGIMPTHRAPSPEEQRRAANLNMTSEERRQALAALVAQAMENAPARLALLKEGKLHSTA